MSVMKNYQNRGFGFSKVLRHMIWVYTVCLCMSMKIINFNTVYTVCILCHYGNTPIQTYRKFHLKKLKIFR